MGALRHTVYLDKATPGAVRKAAEKVNGDLCRFPVERLPGVVLAFERAVADLFHATFPGPSRHAQACAAAQALGISTDTATRILAGETRRIDARIVFPVLFLYQQRFGRAFPFGAGLVVALVDIGGAE